MKRKKALPSGWIKRLHVDKRVIAQNRKDGGNRPAITVQVYKGSIKARRVTVFGKMVFDQTAKQLPCGARLYGETRAAMELEI